MFKLTFKLGANTVKQLVLSGEYLKYSTSPHRELNIQRVVSSLFSKRPNCIIGFQEVGPNSLNLIRPENGQICNSAMFDLSLKTDAEKNLEEILKRGNAIMSSDNNRCVGSFTVEFDRSNDQKNQTRRAACSLFDIENNSSIARVCVCSVR